MTPIEQAIEALKQVESQASTRTMKGELVYVSNFPEIQQAIAELEGLNQRKCAECKNAKQERSI